jgi:hypothetical protein
LRVAVAIVESVASSMAEIRPPYTVGDLANSLGIDMGYVSKVLQALAADRLIERTPRGPVTDVAWEALIRRIVSAYSMFDSNETSTWVVSSGPAQLLEDLTGKNARRWAVRGSFAVSELISVAAPTIAVIYTDDADAAEPSGVAAREPAHPLSLRLNLICSIRSRKCVSTSRWT